MPGNTVEDAVWRPFDPARIAREVSLGATVFDRRANQAWQNNIQVVRTVDATAAAQAILQALKQAGEKSS